jgi:glycosyltransferase involved in cell wall biosynthesis
MPEVCARLEGAILVVAGEFWEDKRLCLERIERLGIADRVIIEDRYIPNEEVPVYFSAADVLVAPYRRVTGSGVVQMARGFGLPAITTVGSEGAATEAGELAGRAVPPGDSQALAAAITDYLKGTPGVAAQGAGPSWDGIVDLIARAASRQ